MYTNKERLRDFGYLESDRPRIVPAWGRSKYDAKFYQRLARRLPSSFLAELAIDEAARLSKIKDFITEKEPRRKNRNIWEALECREDFTI